MGKKVFFGINNTYIRSNQLLRIVYVVFEYNVYTFNTVEDSSDIFLQDCFIILLQIKEKFINFN